MELEPPAAAAGPAPATPVPGEPVNMAVHGEPGASAPWSSEPVARDADAASGPVPPEPVACVVMLPEQAPSPSQGIQLAVRRRLTGKQRAPPAWMSQISAPYVKACSHWGAVDKTQFGRLQPRQQYFRVFNKCRWWLNLLPFLAHPCFQTLALHSRSLFRVSKTRTPSASSSSASCGVWPCLKGMACLGTYIDDRSEHDNIRFCTRSQHYLHPVLGASNLTTFRTSINHRRVT